MSPHGISFLLSLSLWGVSTNLVNKQTNKTRKYFLLQFWRSDIRNRPRATISVCRTMVLFWGLWWKAVSFLFQMGKVSGNLEWMVPSLGFGVLWHFFSYIWPSCSAFQGLHWAHLYNPGYSLVNFWIIAVVPLASKHSQVSEIRKWASFGREWTRG